MNIMKFFAVFLSAIILTSSTLIVETKAGEAEASGNQSMEQMLEDFLTPFYEGADNYTVYDPNDRDISDLFLSATKEYFENGNWVAIKDFYYENVGSLCHQELQPALGRSADLALTETRISTKVLRRTGDTFAIRVSVSLRGTIYYNPNTYVISDARSLVNYVTAVEEQGGLNVNIYPRPADYGQDARITSSTRARISVNFDVERDGFVPFGNFSYSFDMSPK